MPAFMLGSRASGEASETGWGTGLDGSGSVLSWGGPPPPLDEDDDDEEAEEEARWLIPAALGPPPPN